ncbi:LAFE_0D06040g1_1 [Lachancea fermentati]|uniref:LAFE_0D06040g1_1 n=1 Tax=Lachancea fermentati TaxID=4955 RepID=A0A1G4MBL4_LACFM|nr:LAFE_0D06040g1_1 [Lachancea fermentati]
MTEHKQQAHVSAGRLVQTAKFLIDAKSSLLEDLNVENIAISTTSSNEMHPSNGTDKDQKQHIFVYSRASKVRAERVRSYLQFYYHLIEEEVTSKSPRNIHEGVEGVYNPLQVIRNRKLKKKYQQLPKPDIAFLKPPILAIRDFSNNNRTLPWFVDLSERSSDLTWRISHWDELRRPDGKYWFRNQKTKSKHLHSSQKYHHHSAQSGTSERPATSPSIITQGSSSWEVPLISVEDLGDNNVALQRSRKNRFDKIIEKTRKLSRSPASQDKSEGQAIYSNPGFSKTASHTYLTPTDSMANRLTVAEVPINPVKSKQSEEQSTSEDSKKASVEYLELEKSIAVKEESALQKQWNEIKYLNCTWHVMRHRQVTLEIVKKRKAAERKPVKLEDIDGISQPAMNVMDTYREELTEALTICDNWKSRLLNDYSMRVEMLISTSDRVLSDVNTTLTLRLKTLQENIDKFGTLKRMNKQPLTQFCYRVLEVTIVLLFWVVWLVFSVLKLGKLSIMMTLKIIKWIIW